MYYQKKNDELMHYGIKGMKWGKRKARPQISKKPKKQKKPMSTAQKVAIGVAVTAVVVGGAYGAYKVSEIVRYKHFLKVVKETNDYIEKYGESVIDEFLNPIRTPTVYQYEQVAKHMGKREAISFWKNYR